MKCNIMLLTGIIFGSFTALAENEEVREVTEVAGVGFPMWAGVVLVILCVLLIGACAFFYLKIAALETSFKKISKNLKTLKKSVEDDKILSEEQKRSLEYQLGVIMKVMDSKVPASNAQSVHVVSDDFTAARPSIQSQIPDTVNSKDAVITEPAVTKETFYGIPQDGIFSRGVETFVPGTSIYCILDNGGSVASYTLANRKEAKTVIRRSLSRFLEPACDIIGNTNNDFSDIIVKNEGKVKKVNGGWKIIKKAYVELIEK